MPSPTLLREAVQGLAVLAFADLAPLWDSAKVEQELRDVLPALIGTYGAAAATLAADWYDDTRAEAEVRRFYQATPAEITDVGVEPLVGWATSTAVDLTAFRTLVEGGTQRRIANHARLTLTTSAVRDPSARGWKRVGAGQCDFCRMLIGRGAVYREATADFQAHDHCNCTAAPAWA